MNINRVQTCEGVPIILRSPERDSTRANAAGRGTSPEPPSFVLPRSSGSVNDAQPSGAQTLITRINYTKEQLDKILSEYPPFFPAGTFQRADLIKGIRGIQDAVEQSSIQSDLKKEISAGKLDKDATESEIAGALDKLFSLSDDLSKSLPLAVESPKPGSLVSVKI